MLCFLHVFPCFPYVFHMFSRTNLLTRCPGPVSVFCLFLVSEMLYRKYSWIELIIYEEFLFTGKETESKGGFWLGPTATRRPCGVAQGPPAPCSRLVSLASPRHRLFAYNLPFTLKTSGTEKFSTKQIRRRRH